MTLFYAHYPSLEDSFLHFVQENRRALSPWLVVCASSFIAQRLQTQLARTQGAVANIHFCTASSLLYRLDGEAGPALPIFPQDHLRDFLLKDILTEPGLNQYPLSQGFISAVKSALRDLADSLADPNVLEEQLASVPQTEEAAQDKERFAWLVKVYKRYQAREEALPGCRPYQAFFERALNQVENSPYLKQFSQIIWYGFYDMPGRQLELLGRVRAAYPVTVFAPYGPYPAYQFARKFFETNYMGAPGEKTAVNTPQFGALGQAGPQLFASQGAQKTEGVQIISAANTAGEVFFAAKEILRLVQEEKYDFSDIAVLARTQGPYQQEVRRVFAQNFIPLNASFSYPLVHYPLGVFCLNLLQLAVNGFAREDVLAVVSSPYFSAPEKYAWRKLAEKSLAGLNLSQWQDLLPQTENFDPAFLRWLEQVNSQLEKLDAPGLWADKCAQAEAFLLVNIDGKMLQGRETELFERVLRCVRSLAGYSAVCARCEAGEFIRELTQALASLSFNEVEDAPRGVVFTDVLRGRGLQFKAVFLLGVNEKVFPQLIPEDPIFRDRYRYILRDMLGYWVNQQSERIQEERLLFFAACSSARERLYVSYACRGSDGKETVPSVYVAELARAAVLPWRADEKPHISAHFDKQVLSVSSLFLTSQEVARVLALYGKDIAENFHKAGFSDVDLPRHAAAVYALRKRGDISAFDGQIASGPAVFEEANRQGFSPSALQDLAACPMRYFFRKGLHLKDKEDVCSRYEWAANKRGEAYHRVLENFYRELNRLGLTHALFESGVEEYLNRALARCYTPESYRVFGIYPVVWELILEQMRARLLAFVQEDIKQLGAFTPSYFEQAFEAADVPGVPVKLRGIIDRIDVDETQKKFIVADYKSSPKGTDDLGESFFTHLIFQPILYVWAAEKAAALRGFTPAGSCLLAIQKGYNRRSLTAQEIEALRPRVNAFLQQLAEEVQAGTFVLCPSELCAYCPYSTICRKDSFACLMRARKSAPAQILEEARYGKH